MTLLCNHDKPFMIVGPSGTGKTVYVKDMLSRKLDKEKFAATNLFFTKITTPRSIQVTKYKFLIECKARCLFLQDPLRLTHSVIEGHHDTSHQPFSGVLCFRLLDIFGIMAQIELESTS